MSRESKAWPTRHGPPAAPRTPAVTPAPTTSPAPSRSDERSALREPSGITRLQRSAGNRAVAGALGDHAVALQRDGNQGGGAHQAPPLSAAALARAEDIRGKATARLAKIALYNTEATAAIDAYRAKQTSYARRWGEAWGKHNAKISEAGVQAAQQNMIEGVVVGVVAGVLVAAAAAALFPVAAGAALGTATWVAFNAAGGAVAGVGGAAAMGGFGGDLGISSNPTSNAVGRPNVAGPTGGQRDAEADAWQRIAEVERHARMVATLAPRFGLELGNAEYSIAQVQAHIDGGTTDGNWDQTLQWVSTLAGWETSLAPFDREIDGKREAMGAFRAAVEGWEVPGVDALERNIWNAWMATLDNETDEALDQDVIQHHLVRLGLMPSVFYFSDEDQHKAVRAAKARVQAGSPGPDGP